MSDIKTKVQGLDPNIRARNVESLAENSIYEKQEERLNETVRKADAFLERYAKSEYNNEIKKFKENSNKSLKKFKDVRHKNKSSRA